MYSQMKYRNDQIYSHQDYVVSGIGYDNNEKYSLSDFLTPELAIFGVDGNVL